MRNTTYKTLTLAILIFTSHTASATVGGPTYIHSLTYNPKDESVYYIENALNGRGCPPVLKKISLNTAKIDTVYSCDEGEKLSDYNQAIIKINAITKGFKNLSQISLPSNAIEVDVDFVKNSSTEYPEVKEFEAQIFQNKTKLTAQAITGCLLEQPFSFAGYAIPGFNAKIIMISSAKKDCFEGGYIGELPIVVGGVANLDKNYANANNKSDNALASSSGTLTVYEKDTVAPYVAPATTTATETTATIPDEPEEGSNLLIRSIQILAILGLGVLIGKVIKRK